jgi:hypothetical protein
MKKTVWLLRKHRLNRKENNSSNRSNKHNDQFTLKCYDKKSSALELSGTFMMTLHTVVWFADFQTMTWHELFGENDRPNYKSVIVIEMDQHTILKLCSSILLYCVDLTLCSTFLPSLHNAGYICLFVCLFFGCQVRCCYFNVSTVWNYSHFEACSIEFYICIAE